MTSPRSQSTVETKSLSYPSTTHKPCPLQECRAPYQQRWANSDWNRGGAFHSPANSPLSGASTAPVYEVAREPSGGSQLPASPV